MDSGAVTIEKKVEKLCLKIKYKIVSKSFNNISNSKAKKEELFCLVVNKEERNFTNISRWDGAGACQFDYHWFKFGATWTWLEIYFNGFKKGTATTSFSNDSDNPIIVKMILSQTQNLISEKRCLSIHQTLYFTLSFNGLERIISKGDPSGNWTLIVKNRNK